MCFELVLRAVNASKCVCGPLGELIALAQTLSWILEKGVEKGGEGKEKERKGKERSSREQKFCLWSWPPCKHLVYIRGDNAWMILSVLKVFISFSKTRQQYNTLFTLLSEKNSLKHATFRKVSLPSQCVRFEMQLAIENIKRFRIYGDVWHHITANVVNC